MRALRQLLSLGLVVSSLFSPAAAGGDQFAFRHYLKRTNSTSPAFSEQVAVAAHPETGESTVAVGAQSVGGAAALGVYVFHCSNATAGRCEQQAFLEREGNPDAGDDFGVSLAASAHCGSSESTTIVVGAPQEGSCATGVGGNASDNNCPNAGSAYVFRCNSTEKICNQVAYLKASNTEAGQKFGISVGVASHSGSESTVVIGANVERSCATGVDGDQSNINCTGAGSAYVFRCSDATGCRQLSYLKASNTEASDSFGGTISVAAPGLSETEESTVAVSAGLEDSCATGVNGDESNNNCTSAGSVYVFRCSDALGCRQQAYLKASNTRAGEVFAHGVAAAAHSATESTVVVSAVFESSCATTVDGNQSSTACPNAGAAYAFWCSNSTGCAQQAYLKPFNTGVNDQFGYSVSAAALSSTQSVVVVGALFDESNATGVDGDGANNYLSIAGAAHAFRCTRAAGCMQEAYLKASNTDSNDSFGAGVAVAAFPPTGGSVIVAIAPYEDSCGTGVDSNFTGNGCADTGAAYLFGATHNVTASATCLHTVAATTGLTAPTTAGATAATTGATTGSATGGSGGGSSSPTGSDSSSSSAALVGAIVGGVLGCVALAIIAAVVTFFVVKRSSKVSEQELSEMSSDGSSSGSESVSG